MINKITNSFIGGFFRRLGSIFAFILILLILGYFLKDTKIDISDIFGISKVYASTEIIPSTYKHKLIINEYNNGIINRQIDSGWFEGNYTSFCSSGMTCGLDYDYYYITLPSSLDSGRSYNLTFNTWVTTRPSQNFANKIEYYMIASNSGSYSGASSSAISSFSCKVGIEEGTTSKLNFSCLFTPSTQINYIYLRMSYPNNSGMSGFTPFTSFGSNKGSISYDNAQVDALNQQTQIIQEGNTLIIDNNNNNTQRIIDSQNELLGSKCDNLLNKNSYGYDADGKLYFDLSNLISGKTYTLSTNNDVYIYKFSLYNSSSAGSDVGPETWTNGIKSWTFTYNGKNRLFLNVNGLNANFATSINEVSSYNFMLVEGSSSKAYCKFGSVSSKLDDTTNSINNLNDTQKETNDILNDDDTSEAESEASDLFTNFNTSDYGISGIITAPLNLIESLASKTCSPLQLPLPFVNETLTLPCLTSIYREHFGSFLTIYQIILSALIGYKICVSIFFMIKGFKDPGEDKIEVLDL